jgi:predicted  nucleic acid-binding Zn-ribbon protein
LIALVQERDGFKAQLGTLRDKVHTLSRQLADSTDSYGRQAAEASSLSEQIARMEQEHAERIAALQSSIDSANLHLRERSDELEAARSESKRQV